MPEIRAANGPVTFLGMGYGVQNKKAEWAKYIIFKLGSTVGISQPLFAGFLGCFIWAVAWLVIPNSFHLALQAPVIGEKLIQIGITASVLKWINWGCVAFGTYFGITCWCRVAIICYPKTLDRYKIKAGFKFSR